LYDGQIQTHTGNGANKYIHFDKKTTTMTENELKIKKLELEIAELSRPSWKRPAYLTIVISVLTVLISSLIGFGQYFEKVDKDNIRKIEELEKKITENKEQEHKLEIATARYETLITKNENEEVRKSNTILKDDLKNNQIKLGIIEKEIGQKEAEFLRLTNQFGEFKDLVAGTIKKYKEYSPGYANGVINSQSGQAKIKEIIDLTEVERQRTEIGRFAYSIMNQTFDKSTSQILAELDLK
jgi:hypothetical protein